MTVTEKLAALRQNMEARGLEGCIVVTDDFHGSEYVGAHFKAREFLSGFTGSAGTLAVLREGAYLGDTFCRRNGSWRAAAYS